MLKSDANRDAFIFCGLTGARGAMHKLTHEPDRKVHASYWSSSCELLHNVPWVFQDLVTVVQQNKAAKKNQEKCTAFSVGIGRHSYYPHHKLCWIIHDSVWETHTQAWGNNRWNKSEVKYYRQRILIFSLFSLQDTYKFSTTLCNM